MKEEKSLLNCNTKCYTCTHTHTTFPSESWNILGIAQQKEEIALVCSEPDYLMIHVTFPTQYLPKVAATVTNPRCAYVPHIATASCLPVMGRAIDAHVLTAQCLGD